MGLKFCDFFRKRFRGKSLCFRPHRPSRYCCDVQPTSTWFCCLAFKEFHWNRFHLFFQELTPNYMIHIFFIILTLLKLKFRSQYGNVLSPIIWSWKFLRQRRNSRNHSSKLRFLSSFLTLLIARLIQFWQFYWTMVSGSIRMPMVRFRMHKFFVYDIKTIIIWTHSWQ